jgi:FtsP/CotA-like multicopper oxidase with cupredoxin domain
MGQASPGVDPSIFPDGITELPRVGSTELWEIINLTMDAHPMHTHLVQFQVQNREIIDLDGTMGSGITGGYLGAWNSAFPAATSYSPTCTGGVFCPAYGPPNPYNTLNADGALGGNPAIGDKSIPKFLMGNPQPPAPEESGWKDTAKAYPGQVTRMLVRWTPTSIPVAKNYSYAGNNFFPFDPTDGPGYVWHCHIIDHEDNDMMRPYKVTH